MATNRVKIITYITKETDQKVEAFMQRSGLTKSKTCALSIHLGMEALTMAFSPDWKDFFEAQIKASNE